MQYRSHMYPFNTHYQIRKITSATELRKSPVKILVKANSHSFTNNHQQMLKPSHERPLWIMTFERYKVSSHWSLGNCKRKTQFYNSFCYFHRIRLSYHEHCSNLHYLLMRSATRSTYGHSLQKIRNLNRTKSTGLTPTDKKYRGQRIQGK